MYLRTWQATMPVAAKYMMANDQLNLRTLHVTIELSIFVLLFYGKVVDMFPYKCTFEVGANCFLKQETSDDFDWTFPKTGKTGTSKTGPSSAVEGRSYAYIETSSPRRDNDVAILSSHKITMAGPSCLTFAYHMYGRHMGALKVFVKDETGANTVTWSKNGNQGNMWHGMGIDIPSPVFSSRKIVFQGYKRSYKKYGKGDAAIDDITLTPGSCVEGTWGEWANWGPCPQSCGTRTRGTRMRTRPCVTTPAHVGGVYCLHPGNNNQIGQCPSIACPVDGGWAIWRNWSTCAVVNTDVRRSRCRKCTNPIPQYGGASCSGDSLQSEHCPMPVDTFKKTCRCRRRRVPVIINITTEELATVMEETKKALTVDKSKTAMSIRKKTSAQDDRKSTAAMASVLAVVLLSVPVIFIFGIDMMSLILYFKTKISKVSGTIGGNDEN